MSMGVYFFSRNELAVVLSLTSVSKKIQKKEFSLVASQLGMLDFCSEQKVLKVT
jgi:hypothetical protein